LLQALTRDPSWQVRAAAAEGLLRLGEVSAMPLVAELAKQPDPSVRGAAARALSATSDIQAVALLEPLLLDMQSLPRLMAAKALGNSAGPVVPLLVKALGDTDEAVRIAAAGSLLRQLDRKPSPPKRR
jgi:HEAT repeat protein